MSKIINRTIRVGGVLTDVTTCKLSDPTGTYGVKRNDTDAVVVADGTDMTKISTGQYSHTFAEPATGLAYTAYVEVVYGGATYHDEVTLAATSSGSLACDYNNLRREIGRYLDYGRDPADWSANQITDVADILDRGLLQFYYPPDPRLRNGWSFLRPKTTMTLSAPYTTGTVTIVDGVATLAGGATAPSWTAGAECWVDGEVYDISTRDSDTQFTLVDTTVDVDAGTTYEIVRVVYDMPTDYESLSGPMIYAPGQDGWYKPIEQAPEYLVQHWVATDEYTGRPSRFAIRPKTGNPQLGTRYEILFSPRASSAFRLQYRYIPQPLPLDSTNLYPYGGHQHALTIVESCLAVAEAMMNDGGNQLHQQRFAQFLAASIAKDHQAESPALLGRSPDLDNHAELADWHDLSELVVKYDGQSYW